MEISALLTLCTVYLKQYNNDAKMNALHSTAISSGCTQLQRKRCDIVRMCRGGISSIGLS